jgi:hypothetical protein
MDGDSPRLDQARRGLHWVNHALVDRRLREDALCRENYSLSTQELFLVRDAFRSEIARIEGTTRTS